MAVSSDFIISYEQLTLIIPQHTDLLFRLLPELYRQEDVSGEIQKLLVETMGPELDDATNRLDDFVDIMNIEKTPVSFLDHILDMLGNPFNINEFTEADKRRTLNLLVTMYKQKGSRQSIINAVRIVLSINITISDTLAGETFWLIGSSKLAKV